MEEQKALNIVQVKCWEKNGCSGWRRLHLTFAVTMMGTKRITMEVQNVAAETEWNKKESKGEMSRKTTEWKPMNRTMKRNVYWKKRHVQRSTEGPCV